MGRAGLRPCETMTRFLALLSLLAGCNGVIGGAEDSPRDAGVPADAGEPDGGELDDD